MHRIFTTTLFGLLGSSVLLAPAIAGSEPCGEIDYTPVFDPIASYVAGEPTVDGAGILIRTFEGETLGAAFFGDFDATRVIPIASATKLVTGTLVAGLASDGVLDLDAPIGDMLPEFEPFPFKRIATLRQAFSHTAGFPPNGVPLPFDWSNRSITLAESVEGIATDIPLIAVPGAAFAYGGVSMQIAGRVAEVASGVGFEALLQQRLLDPLGIDDVDFDGLGPTTNPRIAGSMRTSLASYSKILHMLANEGWFQGEQVIAPAAIDEIFADQTGDAVLVSVPANIDTFLGYGVGNWVLRRDASGDAVDFGSPGAFGTYPWIDFENRVYGVFFVDSTLSDVIDLVNTVRAFTRDQLQTPCACSIADLAEPLGVLDLADITAFVSAAIGGGAEADLDQNGITDLADIVIFITAFEAGCPNG